MSPTNLKVKIFSDGAANKNNPMGGLSSRAGRYSPFKFISEGRHPCPEP